MILRIIIITITIVVVVVVCSYNDSCTNGDDDDDDTVNDSGSNTSSNKSVTRKGDRGNSISSNIKGKTITNLPVSITTTDHVYVIIIYKGCSFPTTIIKS